MNWEKIGKNYPMEKDMFPVILKRDDGKLFYVKSYPNLIKRKWLDCISWVIGHKWTYILRIEEPPVEYKTYFGWEKLEKEKDREILPISELPEEVHTLLYGKRLDSAKDMTYDEYKKIWGFVVYNGVIYRAESDEQKVLNYLASSSEYRKMEIPDAIIMGNSILKNRFGGRF